MNVSEIINLFETISTSHTLISDFKCIEPIEQQITGEDLYPNLTLELPLTWDYLGSTKNYKIAITLLDRNIEGKELETIDKCQQIAEDIIEYLNDSDYSITTPNLISIQDSYNDRTSGIRMEFDLIVMNNKNRCYLPFN